MAGKQKILTFRRPNGPLWRTCSLCCAAVQTTWQPGFHKDTYQRKNGSFLHLPLYLTGIVPEQLRGMTKNDALNQSLALVNRILQSRFPEAGLAKAFAQRLWQILDPTVDNHLSLLPLLACEAAGGDPQGAIPLMAAWRLLRLSAKLLDDVVDGESAYHSAEAVGLATGLLFLAPLALGELSRQGVPSGHVKRLTQSLYEAGLRACAGQHAELTSLHDIDPDGWLGIARAKSGEPCAWAAWAGALVAGANEETSAGFREYGMHSGVLLQAADDFNGIWQSADDGDLRSGQLNLSLCYAHLVVEGGQRNKMDAWLKDARHGDGVAARQLRQLLMEAGAQAYLLVVGRQQRQQALAGLRMHGRPILPLVDFLDRTWPALGEAAKEGEHYSGQT
jgi:geranylgeranyl pyrophosphate synthase